jgi:hypothetical protein
MSCLERSWKGGARRVVTYLTPARIIWSLEMSRISFVVVPDASILAQTE